MTVQNTICYIALIMKILLISTGGIIIQQKYLQLAGISVVILGYMPVFYAAIAIATNSSSNVSKISESISMFLIFFSPFCLFFITILHKHVFINMLEHINGNDASFIEVMNRRFLQLVLVLFSVIMVCEIPYIICTLTMALVYDVKLGTPESLFFPTYIPWHYDTITRYLLAVMYEMLQMIHPFLVEYGTMLTLGSFYIYIDSKFVNLLASLQNMEDMKDEVFSDIRNVKSQYADSFNSDFIQIINGYENWKSFSKELVSYIADCSGIILLCAMICSVVNIADLTEANIPTILKLRNFCVLAYIFAHLFLVCFLGEYLQNADDKFRDAIYRISWYSKNTKLRKTAIMIMMQTQTPMKVKAYGMIAVNMSLTLRMLRNMYSMLNLYRKSYT